MTRKDKPTYWDHDGPRTMPEITDFWIPELEGVQVVSLDDPAELHNTIKNAVGE